MDYLVHKLTFSEGRAYRYRVTDDTGQLQHVAEPTGLSLPEPTQQITLLDPDGAPLARLEPEQASPWRWTRVHTLVLEGEQQGGMRIDERWTLVDRILLRLPTYTLRIGQHEYVARGHRYGEVFYEIHEAQPSPPAEGTPGDADQQVPPGKVGEIRRRETGPQYAVQIKPSRLQEAPLLLSALVILADLHLYG